MYFYFCNLSFPYKKLESIKEGKKVKVTQSCLTLCNSMDYIVHEILQARILERVAFPFSRGSSQPRDQTQVSHIDSLPAEPAGKPKNTGVGKPIPSPADLPNPGIELGSPALQADSLPTELSGNYQGRRIIKYSKSIKIQIGIFKEQEPGA